MLNFLRYFFPLFLWCFYVLIFSTIDDRYVIYISFYTSDAFEIQIRLLYRSYYVFFVLVFLVSRFCIGFSMEIKWGAKGGRCLVFVVSSFV